MIFKFICVTPRDKKYADSMLCKESIGQKVMNSSYCSSNATVASEAKNESRRYLEYKIEF